MKKIKLIIIILLVCSYNYRSASAQHNSILENFSAAFIDRKVFLSWTIVSGSTCNGIQIFRATDSLHFIQIGDIAGICGSPSNAVDYSFIDEQPVLNTFNYYRLELGSNNGLSEIISIDAVAVENGGYQLRPNPVSTDAKIYFSNKGKLLHNLFLFDSNSKLIFNTATKNDFFEIDAAGMPPGLYFFQIMSEVSAKKIGGKIVVQ